MVTHVKTSHFYTRKHSRWCAVLTRIVCYWIFHSMLRMSADKFGYDGGWRRMHKPHEAILLLGQMFDLEAGGRTDQLITQRLLCVNLTMNCFHFVALYLQGIWLNYEICIEFLLNVKLGFPLRLFKIPRIPTSWVFQTMKNPLNPSSISRHS